MKISDRENHFLQQRKEMVARQLRRRYIKDERILLAMEKVPRHAFVPEKFEEDAYNDEPLPIGYQQTISQPYIVAYMLEKLALKGGEKILEIGTGSGYQTAVLAELVHKVYTIDIVTPLVKQAKMVLKHFNYDNIWFRTADGYQGWVEEAPFDMIVISAASRAIPRVLVSQLAPKGKMILPIGGGKQKLYMLSREMDHIERKSLIPVRFVPMTGKTA